MDTNQNQQNNSVDTSQANEQPEVFQEFEIAPQPTPEKSHKGVFIFGAVLLLMLACGAYWYEAESSTKVPTLDTPARELSVGVDMGEVYTDTKYNFSITPPRDWEPSEGQMGALVFFYESQSGSESFKTNINIVREVVSKDIDSYEYVSTSIEQMKKVLTEYELLSIERVKFSGGEGYRAVGTFKMGTITIVNSQLYFVQGTEAYVVTGTSRKENWAGNKSAFDSAFSTFTLGE
jgi:hypothetical protein